MNAEFNDYEIMSIINELEKGSMKERYNAIKKLMKTKSNDKCKILQNVLKQEKVGYILVYILESLGFLKDKTVVEDVKQIINRNYEYIVKEQAIKTLGEILSYEKEDELIEFLLETWRKTNEEHIISAISEVFNEMIEWRTIVPYLIDIIRKDENPLRRGYAIFSLAWQTDPDLNRACLHTKRKKALPILINVLQNDATDYVRFSVVNHLTYMQPIEVKDDLIKHFYREVNPQIKTEIVLALLKTPETKTIGKKLMNELTEMHKPPLINIGDLQFWSKDFEIEEQIITLRNEIQSILDKSKTNLTNSDQISDIFTSIKKMNDEIKEIEQTYQEKKEEIKRKNLFKFKI